MKKLKLIVAFSIIVLGLTSFASAQVEETPPLNPDSQEFVVVATVNIYSAQIVSQEGNSFKLSFDLSNRVNVQPDVAYAVQLIKNVAGSQVIVDEKIYDESVTLNENQTVHKEIDYNAPSYLSGEFEIWLVAKNKNGLMLALTNPGKAILNGNNQYVEIDQNSCYLTVKGEAGYKKYTSSQGVDITSEETLIAICDATNHADNPITITPQFKTYWRTTFGQEVNTNLENQPTVTLGKKEKKQLSFNLPKAKAPQAYEVVLEFVNDQNQNISNKVTFHYVLRGLSATIQNLRLDKDYYQKGDIAKVSLLWASSADNFPDSRLGETDNGKMLINIAIKNTQNKVCATVQKEMDQASFAVDYELPINVNCQNPNIAVAIQDDKGNILDKKDFTIESQNVPAGQSQLSQFFKYGIILVIIFVIFFLMMIFFKKRKGLSVAIFLLLAGGIFLSSGSLVQADTFTNGEVTYSVSMGGPYTQGDTMEIYGNATANWCSNLYSGDINLSVTANGQTKDILVHQSLWGGTNVYKRVYIPAPMNLDGAPGYGSGKYFEATFTGNGKSILVPYEVRYFQCVFTYGPTGGTLHRGLGGTIAPYKDWFVNFGTPCETETRTCTLSGFTGSAKYKTCTVNPNYCTAPTLNKGILKATPNPCTLVGGNTVCSSTLSWEYNASNLGVLERVYPDLFFVATGKLGGSYVDNNVDSTCGTYYELWDGSTKLIDSIRVKAQNPPPPPVFCPATSLSSCVLPSVSSGSVGTCTSGYSGSCSYSCVNGVWSKNTNTCTAPVPVTASITIDGLKSKTLVVGQSNTKQWSSTGGTSWGATYYLSGTCPGAGTGGVWTPAQNSPGNSVVELAQAQYLGCTATIVYNVANSTSNASSAIDVTIVSATECSDGIDNDGDGLTDYNIVPALRDPGCSATTDPSEKNASGPACDNGLDDDGDGKVDYPTDPGCKSVWDGNETTPDVSFWTTDSPIVAGGSANLRWKIDTTDSMLICTYTGWIGPVATMLGTSYSEVVSPVVTTTYGLKCLNTQGESTPYKTVEVAIVGSTQCNNGVDDDGDGLTDLADPGCSGPGDTSEQNPTVECDDGIDNELFPDGKIDYKSNGTGDPDCTNSLDDHESAYTKPACPFVAGPGDVVVDFLQGASSSGSVYSASEIISRAVPPGNYNVSLMIYDGGLTRSSNIGQFWEKFHVNLRSNNTTIFPPTGLLAQTNPTLLDLLDGVNEASWSGVVNTNFVVPAGVNYVEAFHNAYADPATAQSTAGNSIEPVCVWFDSVPASNTLKICKDSCNSGILFEGDQVAVIGVPINVRACFNADLGCGDSTGDVTSSVTWTSTIVTNDAFDSAMVGPNRVITPKAPGKEKLKATSGVTKESIITVGSIGITQCSDGVDNDSDGNKDYGADSGCTSYLDNDESDGSTQCSDGIDNDFDGKIDYKTDGTGDPDCSNVADNTETPIITECNDGLDNDGDGLIDGLDDSCTDGTPTTENAFCINYSCEKGETPFNCPTDCPINGGEF
ncbi:hypothetical protein A2442_00995 [Candidatus Campbellbacteria bacterium RIFOXYC2_FULL_35_25]|uniref:Uncharacterized protein n=1 Tax=Candidatus Campbellbacteria bacterium RIFOXYC2_FULL_35_25 TaxID=1797582 RepID=A0A1F5EJE3_9BACT|nr:MAG: hypothetical protein A2442_00995 [Candidatus Campbellbacteria bacterium RIFOXYC2_FULL_35_25]